MNQAERIAWLSYEEPKAVDTSFNGEKVHIPKDEFPYIKLAIIDYLDHKDESC